MHFCISSVSACESLFFKYVDLLIKALFLLYEKQSSDLTKPWPKPYLINEVFYELHLAFKLVFCLSWLENEYFS